MKPFKFLQTILQIWTLFQNLGHILRYFLRINENIFICVCKNGYVITERICLYFKLTLLAIARARCLYFIFICLAERFVLYVYGSLTVKCFLE